jgi:hypothetical protein
VTRLSLDVLMDRPDPAGLSGGQVTYQAWQFHHLQSFADVAWWGDGGGDAVLCWDETSLLTDPRVQAHPCEGLFVFVCHDWWCHPLALVRELRRRKRVLIVLRHDSARRFFDLVAPDLPKVVLRPGVEPSVFHPHSGEKRFDVLLSGSETPDYPVRQRLNRLVRERAPERGWSVLDLTGVGLMSGPPGSQAEYAPSLAAARISPTGTNRGGSAGASRVFQYLDHSAARAGVDHPFYGLGTPDVDVVDFDTAGVTPRYLESLASKTLLVGDLPPGESESWYADKMAVVSMEASDDDLADELDRWIRDDAARDDVVERAYTETLRTETASRTAEQLAGVIAAHL